MNRYVRYIRAKAGAANLVHAEHQLAAAAAINGAIVRDIYGMAFKASKTETINSLAAKHGLPKSKVKSLLNELQGACATARSERIGNYPVGRSQPEGKIYRLPTGTPASRLVKHRAVMVERLFRSWYRTSTNESQVRVRVGMDAAATYEADSCFPYRGSYKTYRATASIHTLTVGRRWLTRVHKTGLAVVEGHLVLDAERFWSPASPAGITLYDVAYVVQGRGFEVRLERGVVAVAAQKRVLADSIQMLSALSTASSRFEAPDCLGALVAMIHGSWLKANQSDMSNSWPMGGNIAWILCNKMLTSRASL